MTYIHYELRKLLGIRYIWIFLAIMLAANAVICVYTTGQKLLYSMPADVAGDFFQLYFNDTQRIEGEYADLLALQQERDRLWNEAISQGIYDYEPEPLPNKYIESGNMNDLTLFGEVFERRDAILNYPGTIQKVIDRAYANLAEFDAMGVPADSYTYKYQLKVIELYKTAQSDVRMGLEYTRGWGDYFGYDIVNIFIFAAVILSFAICGVSEMLRKNIPVMSVIVSLTLFPALLTYFGLNIFKYADFTALLAATPMYLLSAAQNLPGDLGLLALFTGIITIITCRYTHVVSDIEYIARDIILLKKGVITDNAPPAELIKQIEGNVWSVPCTEADVPLMQERFRVTNTAWIADTYY